MLKDSRGGGHNAKVNIICCDTTIDDSAWRNGRPLGLPACWKPTSIGGIASGLKTVPSSFKTLNPFVRV